MKGRLYATVPKGMFAAWRFRNCLKHEKPKPRCGVHTDSAAVHEEKCTGLSVATRYRYQQCLKLYE